MRTSRFSEDEIVEILREQEEGAKTSELCLRHGISKPTLYRWKARYRHRLPPTTKLRILEAENRRLKKLLAEALLEISVLRETQDGN